MTTKDMTSHIMTSLVACIIAMMAFWMVEARNYITRQDAINIINDNSPYLKDKAWLQAEILRANADNKALSAAIQRNNEVTSELKTEVAVLNKTLQNFIDQNTRTELRETTANARLGLN